ncbi:MAG TPA: YggT family protein [Acetobacteraceae bacterium]|nr:YggT family protein [Acetobacteraceae bacterium]
MITIIYIVLSQVLRIYAWVVILAAVFMTLVSFGVLDTRNRIVWTIGDFLERVTEPALRRIRRFVPYLGGIDLSPLILLLIIYVLQMVLQRVYAAIELGDVNGLLL